jgi:hypothetical protein
MMNVLATRAIPSPTFLVSWMTPLGVVKRFASTSSTWLTPFKTELQGALKYNAVFVAGVRVTACRGARRELRRSNDGFFRVIAAKRGTEKRFSRESLSLSVNRSCAQGREEKNCCSDKR